MVALSRPGLLLGRYPRGFGRQFIGPGFLNTLAFSRSQAGGAASTALGADGVIWSEFAADVPRFHGASRRLLIAGQRTSGLRNPRCEGLVPGRIGFGAVLPTHWVLGTIIDCTVDIAAAAESGLSAIDMLIAPTGAGGGRIQFDAPAAVTALTAYTASLFCRVVTGSMASLSALTLRMVDLPSTTIGTTANMLTATSASLGSQRFQVSRSTDGTATSQRVEIVWNATGAAAPVTLRFAAPQHEAGTFASTPILPPVGTPGASTRGADNLSAALSAVGAAGPHTILWSGVIPQAAPSGSNQMILHEDDGTNDRRIYLRTGNGSETVNLGRTLSGSTSEAPSLGSFVAGVPFRVGLSVDGAGRVAGCMNGGAVQVITGAPTSGLTTLRVGNSATATAALFGEVGNFSVIPGAVSDSALPTLVSSFPL